MADFVPNTDDALIPWLTNIRDHIDDYSATLGISAGRVTQIKKWCNDLIDAINAVAQAKAAWLSAAADKATQATTSLAGLRGEINQWKANPASTSAIETALKITGSTSAFNPDTFKTTITATVVGDHVKLTFVKGQSEGVNFYWRVKGQTAWKFLSRDTNSPYNDHTPLTVPGTPEVREYQAFGVLNDVQIGQPSDIVTATFGG